ncbi:peptide-methionine (S)-S-oxide reductase [Halostella sp. JP-L12]|uniref:peptide-methionine (S)-S-oxide reductase MsrA n=1 Tax=Halostella TaxID=1843185 RepID=UPI000EF78259|nr:MULTISPECIES: peptide-methionine (S)-S-oxide reductase [Halostella]NHN49625.1 peptide-methionine (S)-S-oxide reductase [Halostella sp. JP-L12]
MTLYPAAIESYDESAPSPDETETATFALGCFWGPDAAFGALDGVVRTRVGYAGGSKADPTYHALGDHSEVVQVDYDPGELSFTDLLDVAFRNHEPRSQPKKRQYQNVVFHETDAEREAIADYVAESDWPADSVETRVEPLDTFYLAEDYHQKFNLGNQPSLERPFEEAGYDADELRESAAATKINAHAAGKDVPAFEEALTYDPRKR